MSKELDKLIEQILMDRVLNEKTLPVAVDTTNKNTKKRDLGLPARVAYTGDIDALLNKDGDPSTLSNKDVEGAYDVKNRTSALRGAEIIRNRGEAELANEIDKLFKKSKYYTNLKSKQDASLFEFDLDPKNNKKVVRSADNIAKTKYLANLIDSDDTDPEIKKKAYVTLVSLVTTKLAGISLVQDVLGSEGRVAKSLLDKFKKSDLSKERLPAKAPKDEPAMTISDPAISTGGSDKARYRSELINTFAAVARAAGGGPEALKSDKFWTNSLKLISDFSAFVNSGDTENEKLKQLSATEYLSLTIALDYCYRFAKEIEAGGGAYQFEAFLGLLANGYVGGKEPGIAGGPGEADFVYQTKNEKGDLVPAMGSAKYYASLSASQSARSFEFYTPVVYVYALKRGSKGGLTSDAQETVQIDNHVFTIEKVYGKGIKPKKQIEPIKEGTGGEAIPLGKKLGDEEKAKVPSGKVVFKFTNTITGDIIGYYYTSALDQIALKPGVLGTKPAGSIQIPLLDRNSLVKAHQQASKKVVGSVNLAFESFKDLFADLIEAKKKATEYSTSADKNTGVAALNAIISSKSKLLELSTQIAEPKDQVQDNTQLEESKLPLDQLIEAIVKEKLLK